jgi:hypothetical protein
MRTLQQQCVQLNEALYQSIIDNSKECYVPKYVIGSGENQKARFGQIAKQTKILLESKQVAIKDKLVLIHQFNIVKAIRFDKYKAKSLFQRVIICFQSIFCGYTYNHIKIFIRSRSIWNSKTKRQSFDLLKTIAFRIDKSKHKENFNPTKIIRSFCRNNLFHFNDVVLIELLNKILQVRPNFFDDLNGDDLFIYDIWNRFCFKIFLGKESAREISALIFKLAQMPAEVRDKWHGFICKNFSIIKKLTEGFIKQINKFSGRQIDHAIVQAEAFLEKMKTAPVEELQKDYLSLNKKTADFISLFLLSTPNALNKLISIFSFIPIELRKKFMDKFYCTDQENLDLCLKDILKDKEIRQAMQLNILNTLQSSDQLKERKCEALEIAREYNAALQLEESADLVHEIIMQTLNFDFPVDFENLNEIYRQLTQFFGNQYKLILEVFQILSLVDPKHHQICIEKTMQFLNSSFNEKDDKISQLCANLFSDKNIRDDSLTYLSHALKSSKLTKIQKSHLSKNISDHWNEIDPNKENIFLWHELNIQILLESELCLKIFENPYEVHKKLYECVGDNLDVILNALKLARVFSPEIHEKLLQKILDCFSRIPDISKKNFGEVWKELVIYRDSEEFRQNTITHLFTALRSPDNSMQDKLTISDLLLDWNSALKIDENSPLYDELIAHRIAADPEAIDSPNNPYVVFNFLKKQLEKEKDQIANVNIQSEMIAEESVKWLMHRPQDRLMHLYTREDISSRLECGTLAILFERLKNRLTALNEIESQSVLKEIKEIKDFDNLQNNLLQDPFIQELLALPLEKTGNISPGQFYLYRCIQAISDSFDAAQEKSSLTQGENILLKFSESVQNCPIGRLGGIASFYRWIPAKYQSVHPIVKSGNMDHARKVIEGIVRIVLEEKISSKLFLKEVTENPFLKQEYHVILYLKNRLYQQLNLFHQLQLDLSTEFFTEALLEKNVVTLLEIFFRHCSIHHCVQAIVNHSNELLSPNVFKGILKLLKQENPQANQNDYFEFDSYGETPISLNEKGALTLLKATKYVHSV